MITAARLAQLDEIRHDLVAATDVEDIVRAMLQLVTVLREDQDESARLEQRLEQLVREAYDLLSNPETALDLRDWLKAAAPFVRS